MKPLASILTGLMVLTFIATTGQDLLRGSTHAKGVTAITTSGDNKYTVYAQGKDLVLYSAGTDTKIKDITGSPKGKGHSKDILDLRFSNKTDLLATASADRTIKLWKMPEGESYGKMLITKEPRPGQTKAEGQVLITAEF